MAKEVLSKDNIKLNVSLNSKEEAIRYTGGILADNGYVEASYIDKMLEREELTSTFMGNNVAIPHGTEDAKGMVTETGLSVVTVPEGIDFGDGNIVKVLIGIAGKGDEHLEVLSKIAIVLSEEENIQTILDASSEEEIIRIFSEVN
ncbi:mannitol-specific phosphotransferase enzyme IIA component [Oceanobacillus picturae]|jgi:mannitol PTS system EIIA component|uniref:Mannitol-specific phosphotransferase enzyme IIA component n=1 Tax=Oceanobacillus picturae TaxID=171693 RepID=W9AE71_9BACI|nr:PTS sugar transporter subunit IIA [Oceanobacillus picturae]AVR00470.1 PTS mannitol transporter subunit IIA [Oceanobacillus iheyensis]NAO99178.1 PTS mannitol transporter subunit IIA [Halomonas sp. MG34]RIU94874.1 PTS mannitol transporter subunit IIA [Oceanobacillus picturae]CDO03773.1 Mannitol-specific phosphotransferase enzyme IIA component [Oceanobacillus picturae]GAQ16912.1 mannitol-specific phosphotransferase enzyme IIA component [Oceanobacillus picturae]